MGRRYIRITDGDGRLYTADGGKFDMARLLSRSQEPAGSFVQMTYPHAAVHRDIIANASHYNAAASGDILYFFATGETLQPHLEYVVTAAGAAQVLFYEAPAVDTAGTPITQTRLFAPSEKTTQAVVTVGGTVTGSNFGTLLKHQFSGGGGSGGNTRGGSSVHDDAEWVLKLDTVYCLRIIRATSQIVSVEFEWYEVPPL